MKRDPKPKLAALYPVRMELRFKTYDRVPSVGTGEAEQMSSRELVFRSDQPLKRGTKLELSLAWPVLLNQRVLLQLVVSGEVVWSQGSTLGVAIWKYHFRTRGRYVNAPPAPEREQNLRPAQDELSLRADDFENYARASFGRIEKNSLPPRQEAAPVSVIS